MSEPGHQARPARPRAVRMAWYAGPLALPVVWLVLSYAVGIPERYLPTPGAVVTAALGLAEVLAVHTGFTIARLLNGFVLGCACGVLLGVLLYKHISINVFLLPSLQAMRAVPPIATIPFFLLWFGFAEIGKILLIVFGVGINLAIASYQILQEQPEPYLHSLRSAGIDRRRTPFAIALPLVAERLLPTLRFSLAAAVGLVITSELLGSQHGLGYLIQSSRSTFAIPVIFLCAGLLGLINAVADRLLVETWKRLVFWRPIG